MNIRIKVSTIVLAAFIFFYPLLPQYFGISISDNLPLITGSRLLIAGLVIFAVLEKTKTGRQRQKNHYIFVLILLTFLQIIPDIVNISGGEEIKDLFSILLEQVVVFYCVINVLNNKARIEKTVYWLASSILFIFPFCILESFFNVNLCYFLNTAGRENMTMAKYARLGISRAEFSFGHPIWFSLYLLLIIPLIIYCAGKYREKRVRFLICFLEAAVCILLTISRAEIFVMGLELLAMAFFAEKRIRKWVWRGLWMMLALLLLMLMFSPLLRDLFLNIVNSVLVELGFQVKVSGSMGNTHGVYSRLVQMQLIRQVLSKGQWLFGVGMSLTGFYYQYTTHVQFVESIDNQYLAWFVHYGIVGLITNVLWMAYTWRTLLKKNNHPEWTGLNRTLLISITAFYISILTVNIATTVKILWLFYGLIFAVQCVFLQEQSRLCETEGSGVMTKYE